MYLWNHQFSKIPLKKFDFCPGRFYRLGTCDLFWLFSRQLYSGECITYLVWINFQGRNLSNLFGGILENWWFHKTAVILYLLCCKQTFWLHLTFKTLSELGSNFWGCDQIEKKTFEIDPFFKKLNDDEASDDEDDTGLLPASRGILIFNSLNLLYIYFFLFFYLFIFFNF